MTKITLNDILNLSDEERLNTKVKFNVRTEYEHPLDVFRSDPNKVNTVWLLWTPKSGTHYFRVGQTALNFISLGNDEWLLTTIVKITKAYDVSEDIGYDAEPITKYEKYFGRVVVKYHNSSRTIVNKYSTIEAKHEVIKILPTFYEDDEFPGYENVCLSFPRLEAIINRGKIGWIETLRNQKAVYLITDNATGKQYVGSATSQNGMLLKRWSEYIANGTGGNKELKALKDEKGFDYIKENFQFSILENYNSKIDDEYIIKRESWWKTILRTREFGYNAN